MGFTKIIILGVLAKTILSATIINKPNGARFEVYKPTPDSELLKQDKNYWYRAGKEQLKKMISLEDQKELDVAKNVIIFIGDGMGLPTITATRIYKGQRRYHKSGEEHSLVYEDFPNVALVKTYNVDKQTPDSAGTATAIFTGVKTRYEGLGVDVNSYTDRLHDGFEKSKIDSLMVWAQNEGKDTGIITTTRITHATPAATYAHMYYRYNECDTDIPDNETDLVKDIARQLIEDAPGKNFKVVLGGGESFLGYVHHGKCVRKDGFNLTDVWLKAHSGSNAVLATTNELLDTVDDNTEYLLGVFGNDNMPYALVRDKGPKGTPSITDMTRKGLQVLKKAKKGYVLMVEGGMIDQAHHKNYARLALEESSEFDDAISLAINETGPETLIIVTADHSHTFTVNGYSQRGNDILGFATTKYYRPKQFLTLSYANGPGFKYHYMPNDSKTSPWRDTTVDENRLNDPYYRNTAVLQLIDETHGGEDVAIYAKGPQSHLIRGVFEQNYIAHFISYASCIGPQKSLNVHCEEEYQFSIASSGTTTTCFYTTMTLILILLNIFI